jgi:NAD-dependent deacetylase
MARSSISTALGESRVLVITGAGISAESGIPTFRGPGGFWRNRDPATLATEAAFRANPQLVWEWYRERRDKIRAAEPNAAHVAVVHLAALARDFLLVTQNVDDLHPRAKWSGHALPDAQCVQIHGDIFETRCSRCRYRRRERGRDVDPSPVPGCPECGAALRPGVVWFGEMLPERALERIDSFLSYRPCEYTLVIGTTALFGYVIQWAIHGTAAGHQLVEINPEESAVSAHANRVIRAPAAVALPQLVADWAQS